MNENSRPPSQRSTRASKKSATRVALIRAAVELFEELGYADTTLEAVAARANLHVQTLYRHFANKELLAVAPEQDGLAQFKIAMRNKDPEQPFSDFWREWAVASATRTMTRHQKSYLKRALDTADSPAVAGQAQMIAQEYLKLLEYGLADELKVDPRASRFPGLFAAMLWGGNRSASVRWRENFENVDVAEEVSAVVDDVCALMRLWQAANSRDSAVEDRDHP
jgi:AcrR family transcriptional regulator